MNIKTFQDHPTLGFIDWVLRGIGQYGFKALVPVPPAEAVTPEENLRRYREAQRSGGSAA
jgi:urea transporter